MTYLAIGLNIQEYPRNKLPFTPPSPDYVKGLGLHPSECLLYAHYDEEDDFEVDPTAYDEHGEDDLVVTSFSSHNNKPVKNINFCTSHQRSCFATEHKY